MFRWRGFPPCGGAPTAEPEPYLIKYHISGQIKEKKMTLARSDIYENDLITIKQYNEHTVKIVYLKSCRKKGYEPIGNRKKKGSVNEKKLDCNVDRAKSKVKELVLCNQWDYWCTFTINPEKYDRYRLKEYMKDFAEFIHNYNRRKENGVKYLLIPEQHKDGAWHVHGFITGIAEKDMYLNANGYLTWKQYENKFGYISMKKLEKDIDRLASYCTKYMTKDTSKNVQELGAHLYYASQGLKTAKVLFRGHADVHAKWDWEHREGFCKIKTIDTRVVDLEEIIEVLE